MVSLRLKLAANAILPVYKLALLSDVTAKFSIRNVQTYSFTEELFTSYTYSPSCIFVLRTGSSVNKSVRAVANQLSCLSRFMEQIDGGAPPRLQRAVI
jgi:hypothetical protein